MQSFESKGQILFDRASILQYVSTDFFHNRYTDGPRIEGESLSTIINILLEQARYLFKSEVPPRHVHM